MEGKKLRKRDKEGKFRKSENKKRKNIEALYERLKRGRKRRSPENREKILKVYLCDKI